MSRILRHRLDDLQFAIDQIPDRPSSGPARILVQVYNGGSMPTSVPGMFLGHPIELSGDECEGCLAGKTVDSETSIPVVVLGPKVPVAGDKLVATSVAGRWVAEKTQTTSLEPPFDPCVGIHTSGGWMLPESITIVGVGELDLDESLTASCSVTVETEGTEIDVPLAVKVSAYPTGAHTAYWRAQLTPPNIEPLPVCSGLLTVNGDPASLDNPSASPPVSIGDPWTLAMSRSVVNTLKVKAPSGAWIDVFPHTPDVSLSGSLVPGWQCCTFADGWPNTPTLDMSWTGPSYPPVGTTPFTGNSGTATWVDKYYGTSPPYGGWTTPTLPSGDCTLDDTHTTAAAVCGGVASVSMSVCQNPFGSEPPPHVWGTGPAYLFGGYAWTGSPVIGPIYETPCGLVQTINVPGIPISLTSISASPSIAVFRVAPWVFTYPLRNEDGDFDESCRSAFNAALEPFELVITA